MCGSVGAGNDRNERYPTFPTIALPAGGGEAEAGNFCRIWADFAWRVGLDEGIWEVRETINFSTGAPITTNNKLTNCAAAIYAPPS